MIRSKCSFAILFLSMLSSALQAATPTSVRHVEMAQTMFVLKPDTTELPKGLSVPTNVTQECGPGAPSSEAAEIAATVIGWVSKWIVSGISKWVDNSIAAYSASYETPQRYEAFFKPSLWHTDAAGNQVSCLLIIQRICDVDANAADPQCDNTVSPRLIAIAQYRRTVEFLQVRPLYVRLAGVSSEKYRVGKAASIAIQLKLEAVWVERSVGHSETVFDQALYAKKFTASDSPQELAVKLTSWERLPALPLPPLSDVKGALGAVSTKVTVAEAAEVPGALSAISKFLDKHSDDAEGALKNALTKLVGG